MVAVAPALTMTFGQWMRETREAKRLGVVDCARRAKMVHSQWVKLENDEPRRSDGTAPQPRRVTVERVALALDVRVDEALRRAGYLPDEPELTREPFDDDLPPNAQRVVDELKGDLAAAHRVLSDEEYRARVRSLEAQQEELRATVDARLRAEQRRNRGEE